MKDQYGHRLRNLGQEFLTGGINDEDTGWVGYLPSILKLKTSRSSCTYSCFQRPKQCCSSARQHTYLCSHYSLCWDVFQTPSHSPSPHRANSWFPGHPLRFSTNILPSKKSPRQGWMPFLHSYRISLTSLILYVVTVSSLCCLLPYWSVGDSWRAGLRCYFSLNSRIWQIVGDQ